MLGSLPRSVLNRDTDPLPESADRKMPVPGCDRRQVRQAGECPCSGHHSRSTRRPGRRATPDPYLSARGDRRVGLPFHDSHGARQRRQLQVRACHRTSSVRCACGQSCRSVPVHSDRRAITGFDRDHIRPITCSRPLFWRCHPFAHAVGTGAVDFCPVILCDLSLLVLAQTAVSNAGDFRGPRGMALERSSDRRRDYDWS